MRGLFHVPGRSRALGGNKGVGRRSADVMRLACDSEWKEATSTLPAQPGVTNNHTRSLRCLVCYGIMSQEPKIHLGMTVIVVELGAKEMARTVVEHKVKKKKKKQVGEAQSGFSVFLIQQNWSFFIIHEPEWNDIDCREIKDLGKIRKLEHKSFPLFPLTPSSSPRTLGLSKINQCT